MERGDRLEYATNPPEPYADEEIISMERRAKGKFNLLVRLYRSTGCCLQEITHLWDTDINPYTKTIFIHEKTCTDCPDCRSRGGVWRHKRRGPRGAVGILPIGIQPCSAYLGSGNPWIPQP
jgi:hypothetical protein